MYYLFQKTQTLKSWNFTTNDSTESKKCDPGWALSLDTNVLLHYREKLNLIKFSHNIIFSSV